MTSDRIAWFAPEPSRQSIENLVQGFSEAYPPIVKSDCSHRSETGMKHTAECERIKRGSFAYLKEAKRHSEQTVDIAAKALSWFEDDSRYRDFKTVHSEQAVAFKRRLAEQTGQRSGVGSGARPPSLKRCTVAAIFTLRIAVSVSASGKPPMTCLRRYPSGKANMPPMYPRRNMASIVASWTRKSNKSSVFSLLLLQIGLGRAGEGFLMVCKTINCNTLKNENP